MATTVRCGRSLFLVVLNASRGVVVTKEGRRRRRSCGCRKEKFRKLWLVKLTGHLRLPARLEERVRRGWTEEGHALRSSSQQDTDLDHSAQFWDLCML